MKQDVSQMFCFHNLSLALLIFITFNSTNQKLPINILNQTPLEFYLSPLNNKNTKYVYLTKTQTVLTHIYSVPFFLCDSSVL